MKNYFGSYDDFVDGSKSFDLLVDKRVFKDLFPGVPLLSDISA